MVYVPCNVSHQLPAHVVVMYFNQSLLYAHRAIPYVAYKPREEYLSTLSFQFIAPQDLSASTVT